jgi:hypothetical protein
VRRHYLIPIAAVIVTAACGSDSPTGPPPYGPPVLTSVRIAVAANPLQIGQSTVASATALDQFGAAIASGAPVYSSTQPGVASVSPTTGEILAIAAGTTIIDATIAGKAAQVLVRVLAAPILINEVKPDGDASGGWVELFNPTDADVDVSAWLLTSSNVFHSVTLPPGTTIAVRGYLAINETKIPSGLGAVDAVHLFNPFGVGIDEFAWTADPPTSFGRCPDGTGEFLVTAEDTKGSTNACTVVRLSYELRAGAVGGRLFGVRPEWTTWPSPQAQRHSLRELQDSSALSWSGFSSAVAVASSVSHDRRMRPSAYAVPAASR